MAVWEVDLERSKITNSPELNLLFGLSPDATPTFEDIRALYAPGEEQRLATEGATLEEVRARSARGEYEPRRKGAPIADRTQIQAEVSIITPAGIPKRLLLRAQYKLMADGRPQITGVLVDITERKRSEERLAIVARELEHRVKNSLSIVQALAIQTFRHERDVAAAIRSFSGRVEALSAATDLIVEGGTPEADLDDIVNRITKPYRVGGEDCFVVEGGKVRLPARMATAIGMALHELCTNAIKYGALSNGSGRVFIMWQRTGGYLVIEWREQGGPGVATPDRQGFGTRLLKSVVRGELGGSVKLDYNAAGVSCQIKVRLQEFSRP